MQVIDRINKVKREPHSYIKIALSLSLSLYIYTPKTTTAKDFRRGPRSKYFMTINKAPEIALKINSQS